MSLTRYQSSRWRRHTLAKSVADWIVTYWCVVCTTTAVCGCTELRVGSTTCGTCRVSCRLLSCSTRIPCHSFKELRVSPLKRGFRYWHKYNQLTDVAVVLCITFGGRGGLSPWSAAWDVAVVAFSLALGTHLWYGVGALFLPFSPCFVGCSRLFGRSFLPLLSVVGWSAVVVLFGLLLWLSVVGRLSCVLAWLVVGCFGLVVGWLAVGCRLAVSLRFWLCFSRCRLVVCWLLFWLFVGCRLSRAVVRFSALFGLSFVAVLLLLLAVFFVCLLCVFCCCLLQFFLLLFADVFFISYRQKIWLLSLVSF